MVWFDRNHDSKKTAEAEPKKTPEPAKPVAPVAQPAPLAAAAEPKPAPKEVVPAEPAVPGLVGYLYKG